MVTQLSHRAPQHDRAARLDRSTRLVLISGEQEELALLGSTLTESGLQVKPMLLAQFSWCGAEAHDIAVVSTGEAGPLWQEAVHLLKTHCGIPVLALVAITAPLSAVAQLGADEVAFLPVRLEELRARIDLLVGKASLNALGYPFVERRHSPPQPSNAMAQAELAPPETPGLVVKDWNKQVLVEGREIHLTPMLYKLLLLLCSDPGRVFSIGEISAHLWPKNRARPADVQQSIYLLRKKIEKDPRNPEWVLAKPGFGYWLKGPSPD